MSEYSFFADPTMGGAFPSTSKVRKSPINWQSATVEELLQLLQEPHFRQQAISFLNKKRETEKELALSLWNSSNTTYLLITEVTSVYHLLTPDKLTTRDSTRVCNAVALLQQRRRRSFFSFRLRTHADRCLASHPDTKMMFLNVQVPHYLYPFLTSTETGRPFQYLRLTSLGAIAALVKDDDPVVPLAVHFFLETEMVPMCFRSIEVGDILTQSVATMILSKILMEQEGLKYCCGIPDRFFALNRVFTMMLEKMGDTPPPRLLKNIIQCYLRMSEAPRACDALRRVLPPQLRSTAFINAVRDDTGTLQKLKQLFYNVTTGHWANQEPVEDVINTMQNLRIDN